MRVTEEQARAAFERWADSKELRLHRRDMPGSLRIGQYCDVDVQNAFEAFCAALSHAAGQEVVAYRWLRNGEAVSEWRDGVPTERQIQYARELIGTADWQPQFAYLAPAVARSEGEG